ncbi:hypothetical protein V3H18_09995 [Methylocystis sp. 9N]|uniref:Uncharacterized protein n=1 Tax=Methylocystis borbori TaxID=3118750 RepID=A0ABU7XIJ5_9HYPH
MRIMIGVNRLRDERSGRPITRAPLEPMAGAPKMGTKARPPLIPFLARFPIGRNRPIDKKSRQINKLAQVLIEKVRRLF